MRRTKRSFSLSRFLERSSPDGPILIEGPGTDFREMVSAPVPHAGAVGSRHFPHFGMLPTGFATSIESVQIMRVWGLLDSPLSPQAWSQGRALFPFPVLAWLHPWLARTVRAAPRSAAKRIVELAEGRLGR